MKILFECIDANLNRLNKYNWQTISISQMGICCLESSDKQMHNYNNNRNRPNGGACDNGGTYETNNNYPGDRNSGNNDNSNHGHHGHHDHHDHGHHGHDNEHSNHDHGGHDHGGHDHGGNDGGGGGCGGGGGDGGGGGGGCGGGNDWSSIILFYKILDFHFPIFSKWIKIILFPGYSIASLKPLESIYN